MGRAMFINTGLLIVVSMVAGLANGLAASIGSGWWWWLFLGPVLVAIAAFVPAIPCALLSTAVIPAVSHRRVTHRLRPRAIGFVVCGVIGAAAAIVLSATTDGATWQDTLFFLAMCELVALLYAAVMTIPDVPRGRSVESPRLGSHSPAPVFGDVLPGPVGAEPRDGLK
jgi:MFS family permease